MTGDKRTRDQVYGFGRVRASALCIDESEAIKAIASSRTST
ncbi:hypothetical protein VP01_1383g5 [Puccinia sorghi]|uniref:Uncharacterized protein n=1 Tax=Puccinia sorghi TaxID=27349 RepID=A0A0L6VLX6_9BASI|nr:hypothetical protein VP01_1383g5 [Puccinia sorghi]